VKEASTRRAEPSEPGKFQQSGAMTQHCLGTNGSGAAMQTGAISISGLTAFRVLEIRVGSDGDLTPEMSPLRRKMPPPGAFVPFSGIPAIDSSRCGFGGESFCAG
jgi:hypothetical protein